MKIDNSFVLKKGETLVLKKKNGFTYLEFTRRKEKYLSNMIELEYKNTRSKKKEAPVWIIEKDFLNRISYEMNSCDFEFYEIRKEETGDKKESNDSK